FEFGTRRAGQDRAGRLCRFRVSNHPGRAGRLFGAWQKPPNRQERLGKTLARAEVVSSQKGAGVTPGVTCQKASRRGYGGRGCVIRDGVGCGLAPWASYARTLRHIAWLLVAAAIVWAWWRPGPTSFNARWPNLPAAMSLQMFNAARKAADR